MGTRYLYWNLTSSSFAVQAKITLIAETEDGVGGMFSI
jgi:hypothetical protein